MATLLPPRELVAPVGHSVPSSVGFDRGTQHRHNPARMGEDRGTNQGTDGRLTAFATGDERRSPGGGAATGRSQTADARAELRPGHTVPRPAGNPLQSDNRSGLPAEPPYGLRSGVIINAEVFPQWPAMQCRQRASAPPLQRSACTPASPGPDDEVPPGPRAAPRFATFAAVSKTPNSIVCSSLTAASSTDAQCGSKATRRCAQQ